MPDNAPSHPVPLRLTDHRQKTSNNYHRNLHERHIEQGCKQKPDNRKTQKVGFYLRNVPCFGNIGTRKDADKSTINYCRWSQYSKRSSYLQYRHTDRNVMWSCQPRRIAGVI